MLILAAVVGGAQALLLLCFTVAVMNFGLVVTLRKLSLRGLRWAERIEERHQKADAEVRKELRQQVNTPAVEVLQFGPGHHGGAF